VKVKVFLGLTFYSDNSFAKNIQQFRKRFDEKYPLISPLHLAIVPPFEIESSEIKSLSMELIEELDSFYFENLSHHSKFKESQKTFLTIGRFQDGGSLHLGIEEAKKDFSEFSSLPFKSICMFTKTTANWSQETDLITFERPVEKFLQNSFSTL